MATPRERGDGGEQDLFRARLDQIIDMEHALARLAQAVEWPVLEARFGAVYSVGTGMPPLPPARGPGRLRLLAGRGILKHTFDLSDRQGRTFWRPR
jgi:transposase, IS5 family